MGIESGPQLDQSEIRAEVQTKLEPSFDFELDPSVEPHRETLIARAKEGFQQAYRYADGFLPDLPINLTRELYVRIGPGENHGAQGAYMYLSAPKLLKELPVGSTEDLTEKSLFIHELFHNFQDEEAFPMFAELIFDSESHLNDRFHQIKDYLEKNVLEPPYIEGLSQIANWLGVSSNQEALSYIQNAEPNTLKQILIDRLREYTQQALEESKKPGPWG